ncbi:cobyric acid synthase CobQ [Brevibacillus reuszeri]|uniref:Cobyric acid synthase n=1 Tax=Brevibacillus reuszeri TaxID=54915 RepID=A0A0K9YYF6_9BACL|nr:cobyric acid synthase [Brevibacillus reuszeri]KNB73265.1 cobalamin biosynthesis protein CobQ [Brevibacillus reuszeri]MED1856876.1 cobyric acid synthase [Brevibacillus reuszeri]GED68374.1 cobyric acid synthase CobQ [Brevibacillus reuszeri]
MHKSLPLMIQGTSSDAGKSAIATALCRIFAQDGYKTAPFKSQNMALNSYVTLDGKEIGRAQGVQAEAAGILATTDMNPILIKPTRDSESQIVVNGEPYRNMKALAYRKEFFDEGLRIIKEAYQRLAASYERIVIEGAGSPAEVNLNDRELVNMRVARLTNAPVILVADIERGGVFASLVGTLQLLEPQDRDRVIGVIINRFRGDLTLLQPGLDWFEEYTGKPVLGVVPFIPDLWIDAEDSLILHKYQGQRETPREIDIAVLRYPRISNFTDVDPFFVEPDCRLRFVTRVEELGEPDLIVLPGSKNTLEDLQFLRDTGLASAVQQLHQRGGTYVVGLCGGYQMLGESIHDPDGVESPIKQLDGLGLIPMITTMEQKKTTVLSCGEAEFAGERVTVEGYEIHMGQSVYDKNDAPFIQMEERVEGYCHEERQLIGTYFHGLFHNDGLRTLLLNTIREKKGLSPLADRPSFVALREQGYNLLAETVRSHLRLDVIEEQMRAYQEKEVGV